MELPNPDAEDVGSLLDVLPNLDVGDILGVVDGLNVERMLVESVSDDVIQHMEVWKMKSNLSNLDSAR